MMAFFLSRGGCPAVGRRASVTRRGGERFIDGSHCIRATFMDKQADVELFIPDS
jgi:hypothetical protein